MLLARRHSTIRIVLACLFGLFAASLLACGSDEEKLAEFMRRGDGYREEKQYKEAIIEYRNVLQIDPNHASAHDGLAQSYLGNSQLKEAYWELSETVRLDPGNVKARLNYAAVSLAAKRAEDVLEQADAILELEPENATAFLLRGQALSMLERGDEVEANLVRAIEIEQENPAYRLIVASWYRGQKRLDEAERLLREAIALEERAEFYTELGHLLASQESRKADAEAAYQKALELSEAASVEGGEEKDLLASYTMLAAFYFSQEQAKDAVGVLERGIERLDKDTELVYALARYYRSIGEKERADGLIMQATESDPSDPKPFLTVSALKAKDGDLEGALAAAESAIQIAPGDELARLRKAELLVDIGHRSQDPAKIAEGGALVDAVLAESPTSADALFVQAKVALAQGDGAKAIDSLRAAIDARPNWGQAHFLLGSALRLRGEKQRARAELARAVELEPRLADARSLLVKIHVELGEYEYAIQQADEYLKARPDDHEVRILAAQAHAKLGKLDAALAMIEQVPEEKRGVDALFALGRLQIARGDLAAAAVLLKRADQLRPNNARVLSSLLAVDLEQGNLSHSIKRVNDAVAASPEDAQLWHVKGLVGMAARDAAVAEESFKKAIELDPNRLDSYQQLAGLYRATGRMQETLSLYEEAVQRQPESAPTHHFLGLLYEMDGRNADARAQYELALKYDSSLGESKNNLAYLMAEAGQDLDRALKLAQEAKAAMPDSANAADTLGWVLYKRGVPSAAVGYLREAVNAANSDDPGLGEIRSHLSQAYEATGDVTKAIETLEIALADLERLKQSGKLARDPAWAATARANIERLKSSG